MPKYAADSVRKFFFVNFISKNILFLRKTLWSCWAFGLGPGSTPSLLRRLLTQIWIWIYIIFLRKYTFWKMLEIKSCVRKASNKLQKEEDADDNKIAQDQQEHHHCVVGQVQHNQHCHPHPGKKKRGRRWLRQRRTAQGRGKAPVDDELQKKCGWKRKEERVPSTTNCKRRRKPTSTTNYTYWMHQKKEIEYDNADDADADKNSLNAYYM